MDELHWRAFGFGFGSELLADLLSVALAVAQRHGPSPLPVGASASIPSRSCPARAGAQATRDGPGRAAEQLLTQSNWA